MDATFIYPAEGGGPSFTIKLTGLQPVLEPHTHDRSEGGCGNCELYDGLEQRYHKLAKSTPDLSDQELHRLLRWCAETRPAKGAPMSVEHRRALALTVDRIQKTVLYPSQSNPEGPDKQAAREIQYGIDLLRADAIARGQRDF